MIVFWVCLILKSSTGSCCQISPLGLCSHLVPLCVCKCVGVWKREHVQSQVGQRTDFLVPCGDSKTFIFNFRDFLCGQNRKLHHLFLLLSNTFHFTGSSLTLDKTREDIRWAFLHPSWGDVLFLQPFHFQPNHEGVFILWWCFY